MIVDALDSADRYRGVHPGFGRAFDVLRSTDLGALPPGRHDIDGDRLYLSIDHVEGRGHDGARLEAHRRYIDIQLVVAGVEEIGWRPLDACRRPDGPFDAGRDIAFFDDRPDVWLTLGTGRFAVFFPADAHAPLAGRGPVRKAILKVEA